MPNQPASARLHRREHRRSRFSVSAKVCAAAVIVLTGMAAGTAVASANVGPDSGAQTRSRALLSATPSSLGTIVVDSAGRTVYVFAADSKGHSKCTGSCLTYWPLVPAPSTIASSIPGISSKVGFIKRSDGKRQLTLNGLPLYRFAGDAKAGQTNGQGSTGSGAKWWVVSPSGKPVTTKAAAGSAGGSSAPAGGSSTTPPPAGGTDIYSY